MDRPTRRAPKGHHQQHQRRSQSHHVGQGGCTSTESENEDGSAVYESLTMAHKGRINKSAEVSAGSAAVARRQAGIAGKQITIKKCDKITHPRVRSIIALEGT